MRSTYWLWPLPPSGSLRIYAEWPALGIELSSVELQAERILEAAARIKPFWTS